MAKEVLGKIIDDNSKSVISLADDIFRHAELGFKEFKTKEKIKKFLEEKGLKIAKEYFKTGFEVSIGSGKPHIGLIAELDGIPTLNHPYANSVDNAAHSCAHSTQVGIMINALLAIKESGILDKGGKITLFFTPAEEFCDIDYRKELIKKGEIKTLSGKTNMILAGIFDDVDCLIHLHASGEYRGYRYSLDSTLAGFIYKRFHFLGKAAHAAVLPHEGINALNAFNLYQNALAFYRETFKEEDMIRIHGILVKGGDTVNSIPSEVIYESYVRSTNTTKLFELSDDLTNMAKSCANALKAKCVIEDIPGYLPLHQDKNLNQVIYDNVLRFVSKDEILTNEVSVAAGDIGDLSAFKPCVQFGYTGFKGVIHGKDLMILDNEEVYIKPAKIVAYSIYDLLNDESLIKKIKAEFKPIMDMNKYKEYLGVE